MLYKWFLYIAQECRRTCTYMPLKKEPPLTGSVTRAARNVAATYRRSYRTARARDCPRSLPRQQVRTNNDVEEWHWRVKQEAHLRGDLNLYLLIKLLHDEAQHARLQVRLLSEGRLRRHVRRNVMSVNGRLQALWDGYDAGDVSTSTFLRRAARLQLPNWLQ